MARFRMLIAAVLLAPLSDPHVVRVDPGAPPPALLQPDPHSLIAPALAASWGRAAPGLWTTACAPHCRYGAAPEAGPPRPQSRRDRAGPFDAEADADG